MASTASAENFNRYKYAANNPYKFLDPDGRSEEAPEDEEPGPEIRTDFRSMSSHPGLSGSAIRGALPYEVALKKTQESFPELSDAVVRIAYDRLRIDNPESASEEGREISSQGYWMIPYGGIDLSSSSVGTRSTVSWSIDTDRKGFLALLIHTHGAGGEWFYRYFSPEDMLVAKEYGVPVFMANPEGDFRVYLDGMKSGGRVGPGSALRLPSSSSQGALLCTKCIPTR